MSEGETSGNGRMTESQTPSSWPGLTRLRGRSRFGAAKARPSTAAREDDVDARDKPGHDERRGRVAKRVAAIALLMIVFLATALTAWTISLGPLPLQQAKAVSTTVVDRHGKLLRAYAMADGRWRLPVHANKDVDPTYLKLLLAYEDQRFYDHHGVDPRALARAAVQLGAHGHIVSGGSTITMQLARLLEPRAQRSLQAKLRQIVRAIELERRMSKDEILDLYLTLAPYGGNLEGIRSASIAYFGKEPKRLSLAEAALLVALPQSPETRRLDRHPEAARRGRDRVLDRMVSENVISADDAAQAKAQAVPALRKPMPILAPHAADQATSLVKDQPVIQLTLDATLQKVLEPLARDRAIALGPNISVGIIVVDNDSGDVLAHVGSADYFDERRAGQVDMTRAVRSPGSTLKPFIYGLAFEDGFVHPESLIEDRPVRFGSYAPENFDMTFQGTVPVRKALQLSLNVPAIVLLDRVGASRLSSRLKQAGANLVLPKDEAPGLAMGLGGVGVTLQDLAQLYAGFPRLGTTRRLREIMAGDGAQEEAREPMRLMDSAAAWQVGNVLLGTPPPENAARNRIAFKTGTSYGYRDAWSVGFDGRVTIGVWVGRPDGAPVPGLIGRVAAAPILFDAFARGGKLPAALPKPPKGALVASNSKLPLPLRRFRPLGELVRTGAEQAPHIQFPLNGSHIDVDRAAGLEAAAMPVKVSGGVLPLTMLVNGLPVGEIDSRRQRLIDPPGPGFARLTVIDATGAADTVVVRIQ
ncbi:penicillin-binding protein 1C [Bradyrhizobium ontarionense]|uniref:peptidoglycan glycosyltransferase n=2 Tax=Bradyrhizobium ontarionense TaxID=2898149 RepID=A0ABY3RFQ9_9BRAD|nr:penicillin-binding protein 1C [Bradyrhizobium sp. A19]UFZ05820.1 penicillin-binding protein 1C [Bradyrhizobium sp. A19]